MVRQSDFSSLDNLNRHVAETAERAADEARRRQEDAEREQANRASAAQAEAELATTSKFDWMALSTLDDHPMLRKATADVAAAEQRCVDADAALVAATAHLQSVEDAAARGRRDDGAMTQALARIESARSQQRIAARGVELAEANRVAVYRAVNFACGANLRRQHDEAVLALNRALGEAQACSQRAAAIEDQSRALLPTGPYAPAERRLAPPVRLMAWRKEFGPRGYLSYWREFFKLPH